MPKTATQQQYSPDQVQTYLRSEAGRYIDEHPDGSICVIVNLKGAFTLAADFCRYLNDNDPTNQRVWCVFVACKSYGDGQAAGNARIDSPLSHDDQQLVRAADHLLLIEDILETATAASYLVHIYLPQFTQGKPVEFFPVFDKVDKSKRADCPPTWNNPLPVSGWVEGEGMGTGDRGRFKRGIAAID